jgi:nucleotide-binding universal stress UspA family protein
MATILSPTRGGEVSYSNQDAAIAIAKERDARLIFLHFTDVKFLDGLASPVLVNMEEELEHLGEFLLAMAQERASKLGIEAEAEALVQHGDLKESLLHAIKEHQAELVILGSPRQDTGVLTQESLRTLVDALTSEGKVSVMLLHKGEVVGEYSPDG